MMVAGSPVGGGMGTAQAGGSSLSTTVVGSILHRGLGCPILADLPVGRR
jgi:hypothetical protein